VRIEDRALVAGIAGSLMAHVGAVAALPWVPSDRHPALAASRVEFTLEPLEGRPEPPPPPRDRDRPAKQDPAPDRVAVEPNDRAPTAESAAVLELPAEPPTTAEPPPADPDEAARERERRARERRAALMDLSPEAVARANLRAALPSGPRDVQNEGRRRERGRGTAFYSERGSSLAGGLARDANRRPGGRRPPPELHRGTDGSYRWEGPLVSARIHPDGRVTFTDRPGVQMSDGQLGGRFDLNDALTRSQGQDPYGAEKRWFLRETEDLRDDLSEESHEERVADAERRLRGRLRALWGNPSLPAASRRRQLFRIWDGLAEDEVGGRARALIERFVRRALPPGSPHAFTAAELAELNGNRRSSTRFAPYR